MRRSLLTVFCLFISPLFADQVVLKNGDRITGSIVKKDSKTLVVKSEVLGSLTIPWDKVETVSAEKPITVVLESGEKIAGTITPRNDRVEIVGEQSNKEVELTEIAALRDASEQRAYERLLNPGLTELWAGSINLGFAGTQGNAKTRT